LPIQLQYDLAKLWPIVHPMLLTPGQPDPYADVKLAGAFTKSLTLGGSYPAGAPFTEAIKPLTLDADLAVADFEHGGLIVKDLDLPVTLRNGQAVSAFPDGRIAPVATANDGQLDLSRITVDLTADPPRVSMPADKPLLTHATINPLFTDSWLNKFVNNPVFVGAQQATGLVDVTVVRCDRVPAGSLLQQAVPANDGTLTLRTSLTDLHVGSPQIGSLLGLLLRQDGAAQPDSFVANVRDATVTLAHGVATQDMTFQTGRYQLPFTGDVILASQTFRNYSVGVPGAALAQLATRDPNILGRVPAVVPVPITGTLSSPHIDLAAAAGQMVQKMLTNPGLLANILAGQLNPQGGNNAGAAGGNGAAATSQPTDDPAAALGNLLNALGKKKHKRQQ